MTCGQKVTLAECMELAIKKVADSGSFSPKLDVELLCEFVFGFDRTQQIIRRSQIISTAKFQNFLAVVERRCGKEPIAHIVGEQEFWSLPFRVNEHTLIPRPDTETLVEVVLKRVQRQSNSFNFLDIGTGSGCILLSLLTELETAQGVGCDISYEALNVAKENARILKLTDRARFVQTDIMQDNKEQQLDVYGPYACIVSNPPYIPDDDIQNLMYDVRGFEPLSALKGGDDGLAFYRRIITESTDLLSDNGLLAFEVGIDQAADVATLMCKQNYIQVETHNDLAGIPRVVSGYNVK